jgi:YbbR domain-containing protein
LVEAVMRTVTRNLVLLLWALGMAILVWVAATNEENPNRAGTFGNPIPVEQTGLEPGLVILETSGDTVVVTLQGPKDGWDALRTSSFYAWLDLSGVEPGRHDLQVFARCSVPYMTIVKTEPERITVHLERSVQKKVPVQVNILADPPLGYGVGTYTVQPDEVTVSGPESLVGPVTRAVVDMDLSGTTVGIREAARPVAENAQGQEVTGVTIDPQRVVVVVPVEQLLSYKTAPVRAVLNGEPAPGYWVHNVVVVPAAVTLMGTLSALEPVQFVDTVPVSIEGIRNNTYQDVKLMLPEGVTLSERDSVLVRVEVNPVPGGQFVRRPVEIRGLDEERLSAGLSSSMVDIELSGDLVTLRDLQPQYVFAFVDVTDLAAGVYPLVPSVVITPTMPVTVMSTEPSVITVTITTK